MKELKGLEKFMGIMFKRNPEPVMFRFNSPILISIHSWFCKPFMAKWYDEDNQLIEEQYVPPFKDNIKPSRPFVKLIEIPMTYYPKYI